MRRQRPPHLLRQLLHIAGGPQKPVFEGIWSLWYPLCESQRCTSRHQIGKGQARQATMSVHHEGVTYISWTDKRQVNLATTIHDDSLFDRQQRQRHQAYTVLVRKPVAVELYTRFMGGVDRADQLTWNLLLCHRTNK